MLLSKPCVMVRASDPDQHLIRILAKNSIILVTVYENHQKYLIFYVQQKIHSLLQLLQIQI